MYDIHNGVTNRSSSLSSATFLKKKKSNQNTQTEGAKRPLSPILSSKAKLTELKSLIQITVMYILMRSILNTLYTKIILIYS